jgi:hypothetical protein
VDLSVFLRVLWRFRLLVFLGLVLAFSLAIVSMMRIEMNGLRPEFTYREAEVWQSEATLFVTQAGFPWGRAIQDEVVPLDPEPTSGGYVPRFADPSRFISLAILYAHLANSDAVRRIIRSDGPLNGTFKASPIPSPDGNGYLPFINITAQGDTPHAAAVLADRASSGFQHFLEQQQDLNGIPPEKRVQLPITQTPKGAILFEGRSLTRPIFLVLLVLIATVGLVFILENLRPRVPVVSRTAIRPAAAAVGTARRFPSR